MGFASALTSEMRGAPASTGKTPATQARSCKLIRLVAHVSLDRRSRSHTRPSGRAKHGRRPTRATDKAMKRFLKPIIILPVLVGIVSSFLVFLVVWERRKERPHP